MIKKVLTIAGSDCSGGAGIQADLKTICAHRLYGMSVITALTAQNTTGVYGVMEAGADFVAKQIDCVFTDIPPDAVKIGMVASPEIIRVIAKKLKEYNAKNIVIDPVMVATSGSKLISDSSAEVLSTLLLPLGTIITPNLAEAQQLSGIEIKTTEAMEKSAKIIAENINGSVLIKGGHLETTADDLLYTNGKAIWYSGKRVNSANTHGTGCTLSSAIACNLAMGYSLEESVKNAKAYITRAIQAGLNLGKGSGPLQHNV